MEPRLGRLLGAGLLAFEAFSVSAACVDQPRPTTQNIPTATSRDLVTPPVRLGPELLRTPTVVPLLTPDKGSFQESPYAHWERYQNGELPKEIVVAIGRDLQSSTLPGFREVGEVIIASQLHPESLQGLMPLYTRSEPVKVRLSTLTGRTIGQMGIFVDNQDVDATIINKQTGETTHTSVKKITQVDAPTVTLDNIFIDAPIAARQLVIAKEFAHLLYMKDHGRFIKDALDRAYTIDSPGIDDLSPHLVYDREAIKGLHVEAYDMVNDDTDCSGHYQVLRAFGAMKQKGVFSAPDLVWLVTHDNLLKASVNAGILIDTGNGDYQWKQGIGPFSQEWLSVCRPLWRGPQKR